MTARTLALATVAALALAAPVAAQEAGTMTLGFGIANVDPKGDNGKLAGADSNTSSAARPSVTFEYFVRDNLGIEVLAALPFEHHVSLDGLGKVAKATQLPPTITLQYHFQTGTRFTPFVGAGINYTFFLEDKGTGALKGQDIDISDSWGIALHAGFDYQVSEHGALRLDARWIDIDSDVRLNGEKIGKAEIDPLVLGASYVYRF